MSKIVIENNTLVIDGAPVQNILNKASAKFKMFAQAPREGSVRLSFSNEAYKGEVEGNRALEITRAHLAAYDALVAAGVPESMLTFRNVRPAPGGKGYVPSTDIWINTQPRAERQASAGADAGLAQASEAYYAAGGTEAPPAGLPEAAQVGWFKAKTAGLAVSESVDGQAPPF